MFLMNELYVSIPLITQNAWNCYLKYMFGFETLCSHYVCSVQPQASFQQLCRVQHTHFFFIIIIIIILLLLSLWYVRLFFVSFQFRMQNGKIVRHRMLLRIIIASTEFYHICDIPWFLLHYFVFFFIFKLWKKCS